MTESVNSYEVISLYDGSTVAIKNICSNIIEMLSIDDETLFSENESDNVNDSILKMIEELYEFNEINKKSRLKLMEF